LGAHIHIDYEKLPKHIVAHQRDQRQQTADDQLVMSEPAAVCKVSPEDVDNNTALGNCTESREVVLPAGNLGREPSYDHSLPWKTVHISPTASPPALMEQIF
jgi:hypothetical protein